MKKIWIVSELYYPEETSTGYFLTKIAEGLSKYFPVYVLCGQPTYSVRGIRAPAREVHNGVVIRRCLSTALNKDSFLLKLINQLTFSVSIYLHAILSIKRNNIVFVVTNPPILPFIISHVCKLRHAKCVLIIHDVYPEALIAAGMLLPKTYIARSLNWINKKLYMNVDRICVLGRDMEVLVKKKMEGILSTPIVVIPNWADVGQVFPNSRGKNDSINQLGLNNKFVVLYAGNMGRVHGLEDLLESAKMISTVDENVHFLFIGFGAKKKWLEEAVEANHLRNVTILPNRPRNEQQVFLNACDVAITALVPGMSGAGVPSRMYNIFAAGKPIIGAVEADSELALTVVEEKVGWIVPPNQPDKIVDAVQEARANPGMLDEMGRRARAVAENKYTLQHAVDSYRRMTHEIFDGIA